MNKFVILKTGPMPGARASVFLNGDELRDVVGYTIVEQVDLASRVIVEFYADEITVTHEENAQS